MFWLPQWGKGSMLNVTEIPVDRGIIYNFTKNLKSSCIGGFASVNIYLLSDSINSNSNLYTYDDSAPYFSLATAPQISRNIVRFYSNVYNTFTTDILWVCVGFSNNL